MSERRVCGGGECEQWLSMAASVRERVRVCVSLFLSLSLSLSLSLACACVCVKEYAAAGSGGGGQRRSCGWRSDACAMGSSAGGGCSASGQELCSGGQGITRHAKETYRVRWRLRSGVRQMSRRRQRVLAVVRTLIVKPFGGFDNSLRELQACGTAVERREPREVRLGKIRACARGGAALGREMPPRGPPGRRAG